MQEARSVGEKHMLSQVMTLIAALVNCDVIFGNRVSGSQLADKCIHTTDVT